jgi:hypothetical protein
MLFAAARLVREMEMNRERTQRERKNRCYCERQCNRKCYPK